VKPRKPLPKNAVFGLIGGGALLVALVGYMLLIKPQQTQLKEVKAEISEAQQTILDYRQAAQQAKPNAVPKIKVADIYRLARAMPSDVDMPDVLIELNDVAASSGVTIDSISPQTTTTGNGFELEPLTLSCHGDFYGLTDFIYRLRTLVDVRHGQLEAGGRLFAIESIGLQPSTGTTTPGAAVAGTPIQADLKLDAFVYGGTPAATTTPTAPVTPAASTDTTTTSSAPTASAEGAP